MLQTNDKYLPINMFQPDTRHELTIIVPSTKNKIVDGTKIVTLATNEDRQLAIEKILVEFSKNFGGASIIPQSGVWIDSDTGKLVYEKSDRISTLVSGEVTPIHVQLLYSLAIAVKQFFAQDSVLITIDNKGWFV